MHVANALPVVAELPTASTAQRPGDNTDGGFAQVLQHARKANPSAAGGRTPTPDPTSRGDRSQRQPALGHDSAQGSTGGKPGEATKDAGLDAAEPSLSAGPGDEPGAADSPAPSTAPMASAVGWPLPPAWQPPDTAAEGPATGAAVLPSSGLTEAGLAPVRGTTAKHRGAESAEAGGHQAEPTQAWGMPTGRTVQRRAAQDGGEAAVDGTGKSTSNSKSESASDIAAEAIAKDAGVPDRQNHWHSNVPEMAVTANVSGAAGELPAPLRTPSPSPSSWPTDLLRPDAAGVVATTEKDDGGASGAAGSRLFVPGGSSLAAGRRAGAGDTTIDRFETRGHLPARVAREGWADAAPAVAASREALETAVRPASTETPTPASGAGLSLGRNITLQRTDSPGLPTDATAAPAATIAALATLPAAAQRPGDMDMAATPVWTARDIDAPLHSPGFAPALGAQLSLMVRDGVAEATLHLHPADMGPIAVQIQIEGQHARVEMVAEQAVTRQVLEQSMPSLASALRDSGLTLTGGGVFEQSTRQGQPSDTPNRQGAGGNGSPGEAGTAEGNAPDDLSASAGALAARRFARPRGVVDLYA